MMGTPIAIERYVGCLLGLAIGDAACAPYEGLDASLILRMGDPRRLIAEPQVDTLHYTDDTQMAIGVAETLLECDGIDEDALMRAFVRNYDPKRGYGPGARRLIEEVAEGGNWRELSANLFPGGSYGNGGAMRVAPVALRFAHDSEALLEHAERSARVTHAHELGIDGARLIAAATQFCLTAETLDPYALLARLIPIAKTEEFRWQLTTARRMPLEDAVRLFGNSLEAHRSVTTAIICFAMSPDDYPAVLARCLSRGNDVDTLAAMAGALAGAYRGEAAIPRGLIDRFERQEKGLDYLRSLAERLGRAGAS